MPKIKRNLIILQEDCGEVCDTSDNFGKNPGKYFDVIKKDFECDILLTSPVLNPSLEIEEQMPKNRPPRLDEIPKDIAKLYSFGGRVPFDTRYYERDMSLIKKPTNPHWNMKDIGEMMDDIRYEQ